MLRRSEKGPIGNSIGLDLSVFFIFPLEDLVGALETDRLPLCLPSAGHDRLARGSIEVF
jgi:hypothetical protein